MSCNKGIGLFQNFQQESNSAIKVVDQFMQDGAHKDPGAGFNLFSQTARDQGVTQDSIAKLFNTRNDLFQGYKSLQPIPSPKLANVHGLL